MARFWLRSHFYALSAIRIRPPSCYKVKAFPKCLLAAYALEHRMCTMCNFFKTVFVHLWCTHVWSQNIRFHFSVTEHLSRFAIYLQTFGR